MEYSVAVLDFLNRYNMGPECISVPVSVDAFLDEMNAGLAGSKSSIKMLPTYLTADGEIDPGKPIAVIDAGGTNFRTCLVSFEDGMCRISNLDVRRMPGCSGSPVGWDEFISFTADCVRPLLDFTDKIGFCFSYPTEMFPSGDGRLITLTKQVLIQDYEGRMISADLISKLRKPGQKDAKVSLLNDTPAVLLSGVSIGSGSNHSDYIGLIAGTGTNTACILPTNAVPAASEFNKSNIIINLESGGFNGIERGTIDFELDAETGDPGTYLFEKMTSGAYLGTICRLLLWRSYHDGLISPDSAAKVKALGKFDSSVADSLANGTLKIGGGNDSELIRELCYSVFDRAAKCVSANLNAILKLKSKNASENYRICADGSVFRKSLIFRKKLEEYTLSFADKRYIKNISFSSYENATIYGAAIAAALNN